MSELCHKVIGWNGGELYCFKMVPCPEHHDPAAIPPVIVLSEKSLEKLVDTLENPGPLPPGLKKLIEEADSEEPEIDGSNNVAGGCNYA